MKFNIGDKVRYTKKNTSWEGLEGEVSERSSGSTTRFRVTKGNYSFNVGANVGVYTENLELRAEEPKTKFKVGDKVRYPESGSNADWYGVEGEITETGIGWQKQNYQLKVTKGKGYAAKEGETVILKESNLELVPSFTFEDIQEGDTIRRTVKRSSGATEVREGVAKEKGGYYWEDGTGYILAYAKVHESDDVTYELLERPEPKPEPKLWDDAKPGDVLVISRVNSDVTRVVTKRAEGHWSTILVKKYGNHCKGFNWSDGELDSLVSGKDVEFIKA